MRGGPIARMGRNRNFGTVHHEIAGNVEVVVIVVSVCVSRSDDRVTGIIANSVCWWNHPLGTQQLMELAVVGSVSPFACVCACLLCVYCLVQNLL
jgi:hypothetical protein